MIINIDKYDGHLLHNRFAYQYFRDKTLPIGNILAFRAPMHVEAEGMIDHEDVLNDDFIYSDDAINFVWEIPNMEFFGAVCFQRLFNCQLAGILSKQYMDNAPIEVDGDDLIVHKEHDQHGIVQQKGKCSVSITHIKDGAALGHTAINITAGKKAPGFAYSTNLTDEQANGFMRDTIDMFYHTTDDVFIATTKIISK